MTVKKSKTSAASRRKLAASRKASRKSAASRKASRKSARKASRKSARKASKRKSARKASKRKSARKASKRKSAASRRKSARKTSRRKSGGGNGRTVPRLPEELKAMIANSLPPENVLKMAMVGPSKYGVPGERRPWMEQTYYGKLKMKLDTGNLSVILREGDLNGITLLLRYGDLTMAALTAEGEEGMNAAIESGNLALVRFLHQTAAIPFTDENIECALKNGQLEIVQYLHSIQAQFPPYTLMHTIQSGNLDLFKYVIDVLNVKPNTYQNYLDILRDGLLSSKLTAMTLPAVKFMFEKYPDQFRRQHDLLWIAVYSNLAIVDYIYRHTLGAGRTHKIPLKIMQAAWENRDNSVELGRNEGEGLSILRYLKTKPHEPLPFN